MDVWPEDDALLTMPRRRMRRPVAGGIPSPVLESWLEPPEDQPTVPGWVWFAIGAGATALAMAAAAATALTVWFDRTFGRL